MSESPNPGVGENHEPADIPPPPGQPYTAPGYTPPNPGAAYAPLNTPAGTNPYLAANNPSPGQQPYGGSYPPPYYPQPAQPKVPGEFMAALKAFWPTFVKIHQAKTLEALAHNASLKHWWWVITLGFSVISGLAFSVFVARFAHIYANDFVNAFTSRFGVSGVMPYSTLSFQYWLLCFFVFTILAFLVVILRILLVWATAASQRAPYGFAKSASAVATGLVLPSLALAILFIIEMLPIPFLTALLVNLVLISYFGAMFMLELVISVALKAIPENQNSDVLRHGIFYTLWLILAALIIAIAGFPTASVATFGTVSDATRGFVENLGHSF